MMGPDLTCTKDFFRDHAMPELYGGIDPSLFCQSSRILEVVCKWDIAREHLR